MSYGTGREQLLAAHTEVVKSIRQAMENLTLASPHLRDYANRVEYDLAVNRVQHQYDRLKAVLDEVSEDRRTIRTDGRIVIAVLEEGL